MTSLPELPSLDRLDNNFNTGNKETSFGLPSLQEESFDNYLDEHDYLGTRSESELMLNGELANEYQRIKKSYRDLIHSFEQSLQRDMQIFPDNKSRLDVYKFRNLSDFESAVENGFLNLNDYTSKEINDLIKDLNELENRMITRSLDEYNFRTIDEFQSAVDRGIVDLSRYDMKEINDLLDNLEDEDMSINDYDIEMFGDVKLPDIEEVLNTKEKPTSKPKSTHNKPKRQKINKTPYYEKEISLPSPPKHHAELKVKEKPQKPPEHLYEDDNEDIEDLLDDNVFKRFTRWIKELFNKKRGP